MAQDRAAPLEIAERKVREMGTRIKGEVPHGWGYVLCLTELGRGGRLAYAANCRKDSVVAVSRELANRIELNDDSKLDIHHDDETVAPALDNALELLASIGQVITSEECSSVMGQCRDDPALARMSRILDQAMVQAEQMLLEHRPDLMA